MPISDWVDLCPQVVLWRPMIGRDAYGKPTWGAPVAYQGRRVDSDKRVAAYERGTKGQGPEVVSSAQIWILGIPDVRYEDSVVLQGDTGNPAPILSIEKYPDENGLLFVKLMMGSANG